MCQPLSNAFARSNYKVTDDTLKSSVADSDVRLKLCHYYKTECQINIILIFTVTANTN